MSVEPDAPRPQTMSGSSATTNGNMSVDTSGFMENTAQLARSGMLGKLYAMWDVDSAEVAQRTLLALNPFKNTPFLTNGMIDGDATPGAILSGKQPDLWGPVWIYFTLVFAVFFASTMSSLFNSIQGEYDVGMLTGNAATLFAFTFVVPAIAWFSIQYFELVPTLTLLQTVCLYGYSTIVWIPAVVVAGSPLGANAVVGDLAATLVRALLVTAAYLVSAKFVYSNLHRIMSAQISQNVSVDSRRGLVLGAGLVLHLALGFTMYFLMSQASRGLHNES